MQVLGDFVIFTSICSYSPWTSTSSSVKLKEVDAIQAFVGIVELAAGLINLSVYSFCPLATGPPPPIKSLFPRVEKAFPCKAGNHKRDIIKLTAYIKRCYEQSKGK